MSTSQRCQWLLWSFGLRFKVGSLDNYVQMYLILRAKKTMFKFASIFNLGVTWPVNPLVNDGSLRLKNFEPLEGFP